MAKPNTVPTWNTDASNNTTPSGGQQTTGWTFKQKAVSSYFNWAMRLYYLWITWLDGLFDALGNLTMDADASITLSGTGSYKRGDKWRMFPASMGALAIGGAWQDIGGFTGAAVLQASQTFALPIVVDQGERIKEVVVQIGGDGVAGTLLTVHLMEQTSGASASSAVSAGVTSAAANSNQALAINENAALGGANSLAVDVGSGIAVYWVRCVTNGTAPVGNGVKIIGCKVRTAVVA